MGIEDIKKDIARRNKIYMEALERNKQFGEGIQIGKVFRVGVADGYAIYEIVEIGNIVSKVKHRDDITKEYYSDAVDCDGNILTTKLKEIIKWEEGLNKIFKREM